MEEDHAFDIYNDDLDPSASAKEDSNKEREVNIAGGGLTGGGLEDDLFIDFGEIEREIVKPSSSSGGGGGSKGEEEEEQRRKDFGTITLEPSATRALTLSELTWWASEDDLRLVIKKAGVSEKIKSIGFQEHKTSLCGIFKCGISSTGEKFVEIRVTSYASSNSSSSSSSSSKRPITGKVALVSFTNPEGGNPYRTLPKEGAARTNKPPPGANQPYIKSSPLTSAAPKPGNLPTGPAVVNPMYLAAAASMNPAAMMAAAAAAAAQNYGAYLPQNVMRGDRGTPHYNPAFFPQQQQQQQHGGGGKYQQDNYERSSKRRRS